jgi:hypothetical protein
MAKKQLTEIQKRLKAMQSMWAAAKPRTAGITELPEGTYKGKIVAAAAGISKSDRSQVVWDLKVTDGPHAGKTVKRFSGLTTEENMDWYKGDLKTLGIPEAEIENTEAEDMPELLARIVGLAILFKVRTKDEYTNYDFLDVLDDEDADEDNSASDDEPDAPDEKAAKDDGEDDAAAYDVPKVRADVKKLSDAQTVALAGDLDMDVASYDGNLKKLRLAIVEELGL